jgi:hypothetical protein
MLVIKIEIWPFGVEENKRPIGNLKIANDGTGDAETGNYFAFFNDNRKDLIKIKNFPRSVKDAWHLLYEVMKKEYGKLD